MGFNEQQGGACAVAGRSTDSQAVDSSSGPGPQAISAQRWLRFLASVSLVAFLVAPTTSRAAEGDATSSRAARDEAIRAIPWNAIAPDNRRRAQFVVQNASLYRRLPTRV